MQNEGDLLKRLFCLIACVCFLCASAFAESIDLSHLSFEELFKLQSEIAKEIITREEWKQSIIPVGQWVVGKDIPQGEYSVTIPQGSGAHMTVTNPNELRTRQELIDWFAFNDTDSIGKLILEEGYIVFVKAGDVIFSPVVPLGF